MTAYQSNGNYRLITDGLVREIIGILADVDPDIMGDIAAEMVDRLAVVISREIEAAFARGEIAEHNATLSTLGVE